MIFPFTYSSGTKLQPIIGCGDVYFGAAVDIEAAINTHLGNGRALKLNLSAADVVDLPWQDNFQATFIKGFMYALFPSVTPLYPKYFYSSSQTLPNQRFLLVPEEPVGGYTNNHYVWAVDDEFSFNGSDYILYKNRGHAAAEEEEFMLNLMFHVTDYVSNE